MNGFSDGLFVFGRLGGYRIYAFRRPFFVRNQFRHGGGQAFPVHVVARDFVDGGMQRIAVAAAIT